MAKCCVCRSSRTPILSHIFDELSLEGMRRCRQEAEKLRGAFPENVCCHTFHDMHYGVKISLIGDHAYRKMVRDYIRLHPSCFPIDGFVRLFIGGL